MSLVPLAVAMTLMQAEHWLVGWLVWQCKEHAKVFPGIQVAQNMAICTVWCGVAVVVAVVAVVWVARAVVLVVDEQCGEVQGSRCCGTLPSPFTASSLPQVMN